MKYFIVMFFILVIVLFWSAWRDEQLADASTRYENCILEQYGVYPTEYYKVNNQMPICQ